MASRPSGGGSELLLRAVREGVCAYEAGRIVDFNPSLAALFGREGSDLSGVALVELMAPAHRERLAALLENPDGRPYEVDGLRVDGSTFPIEVCARTLDHQRRTVRVLSIQDITTRREYEEILSRWSTEVLESHRLLEVGAAEARDTIEFLQEQVRERTSFGRLIGKSDSMQELFRRLRMAAESDATILLSGESGTGKELAAQAIHARSARNGHPFLAVNCSAIPETLLESELFGHVKGAFTGAVRDRTGLFQAAGGGTLFLDEIEDISPLMQVKLLRALEEREVRRVGDEKPLKFDVRLIAATNRDLAALVAAGKIREDFYYRVRVFEAALPALRERREDIPLLVSHFVDEASKGRKLKGVRVQADAMRKLMEHSWPGNVRELRNAIDHAFVTMQGRVVTPGDLPPEVRSGVGSAGRPVPTVSTPEGDRILAALRKSGGNRTRAAQALGISRVTLWHRMTRLGIVSVRP